MNSIQQGVNREHPLLSATLARARLFNVAIIGRKTEFRDGQRPMPARRARECRQPSQFIGEGRFPPLAGRAIGAETPRAVFLGA